MQFLTRINKKVLFLKSTKRRIAPVFRFQEYAKRFPDSVQISIIEQGRRAEICPVHFYKEESSPTYCYDLPDTYSAKVKCGIVLGGSSVIISREGVILYDLLSDCEKYNANVTDNGLFLLFGHPHKVFGRYIYNYQKNSIVPLEKGISLAANMSGNYYHFMFQVASKFYLLSKLNFSDDIPLLVDQRVLEIPQMKEILSILNKEKRLIIPLEDGIRYKVNNLFCVSEPHIVTPNSLSPRQGRNGIFAFDQKALSFLSYTLRDTVTNLPVRGNKRIFLTRKGTSRRNLNEKELNNVLSKYGFVCVDTSQMSIGDQIKLFSSAEHIIGGSGAAFTNLLFSPKSSRALLFFSKKNLSTCYSSLAHALGIKSVFMYSKMKVKSIHTSYYEISVSELESYLIDLYGSL